MSTYQEKLKYIHPFLFSIFPVLSLFSANLDELYNSAFYFLPILLLSSLLFGVFVFCIIFFLLRKDTARTAVISTLLLFTFFSYGHLFDFFHTVLNYNNDVVRHRFFLPCLMIAVIVCSFYLLKTKVHLEKINNFLVVMASVLLLLSLSSILRFSLSGQETSSLESIYYIQDSELPLTTDTLREPDIYYIILDAYADSDILDVFYDYDNKEFLDFLQSRGFSLAGNSTSNYGYTYASLASSLNMNYLDGLIEVVGAEADSVRVFSYLIENNAVIDALKRLNYTYVHFSSGYPMTNFNRHADVSYRQGLDRFVLLLLNRTVLRPVIDPTSPWRIGFSKNDEVRKRILFEFDKLKEIPKDTTFPHPRFVFTHIVSPHHPYVFDAEGNAVNNRPDDSSVGYLDQVKFLNVKMMEVIDSILENSTEPPVIIIQSDHGVNPPGSNSNYYKFHNFTALYLGTTSTDFVPDDITPVNLFREVFNVVFSTTFPLLENKLYFEADKSRIKFNDITDDVHQQQEKMLRN